MKYPPTGSLEDPASRVIVVALQAVVAVAGAAAVAVVLIGLPRSGGALGMSVANAAEGHNTNACGCYRDSAGSCYCGKKTKCGCPGDCEPRGCDEKRNKQIQKEIDAETRKAEESNRKHAEAKPSSRPVAEPDDSDRPTHTKAKQPTATPTVTATVKPTVKMTAPQRREFLRLLDIYLAEDPDHRGQTIDQARSAVRSGGSRD